RSFDAHEAVEARASGVADPGAGLDHVAELERAEVVDLVPQRDPRPGRALVRRKARVPVRRPGLLQPADVDHVVDVAVLVDVGGPDAQRQDEQLAVGAGLEPPAHAARTPFSVSSVFSSPVENISRTMSAPPRNSPLT